MDLYDFENEHILNITIIRSQVKELSGFSHAFPYHFLIFFFHGLHGTFGNVFALTFVNRHK